MHYVISDIHGEYEKYLKMLDLIHFSEQDELYILGDVCDRGKHPVAILQHMMQYQNIHPIMGNHDAVALYLLKKFCVEVTEENCENYLSPEDLEDFHLWAEDGGMTTAKEFQALLSEERQELLEYLETFPYYQCIDVNNHVFVLVHAGLGNFNPDKKLEDYTPEELVMYRSDPEFQYTDDKSVFVIMGHTPTPFFIGRPEIYQCGQNIYIDCGACADSGRLACLCLETFQDFYI
ncbi:MAG: fructose-bisphosphatase class III [Oscillospiraceae bacterium]|nr:fructose-bisphosphatase class III [Oscillospiraceae bacterium]